MITWNYRLLHNQDTYHIVEIYYDGDGQPASWAVGMGILYWETPESFKRTVYKVSEALHKPVLIIDPKTGRLVEEQIGDEAQGNGPAATSQIGVETIQCSSTTQKQETLSQGRPKEMEEGAVTKNPHDVIVGVVGNTFGSGDELARDILFAFEDEGYSIVPSSHHSAKIARLRHVIASKLQIAAGIIEL